MPGRGWICRAVIEEGSCAGVSVSQGLELGSGAVGDQPCHGQNVPGYRWPSLASVAVPALLGLGSGCALGTSALELVR